MVLVWSDLRCCCYDYIYNFFFAIYAQTLLDDDDDDDDNEQLALVMPQSRRDEWA